MDFAAALYSFLSTNATVTAAVSDRIYPIMLKQGCDYPALAFREMYTDHEHALQADDTLLKPSYEIECHASSHAGARAAMRAVESVLNNYSGAMSTCTVQAVLASGGAEDYDPDTQTYWRSKEFQFFIEEA